VLITGNSGGHLGLLRGKIQRFRLVLGQIGDAATLTEFTKPTSPGQCSSQGSLASDGGLRETCWPFVTVELRSRPSSSHRNRQCAVGTACGVGHKEFAVIEWLTTKLALLRRPNVAFVESLSGAFQLWIGPRRIRHSNPFGGVAGRVVMKPNLLGAAGPGSYAEAADLVFPSVSPQSSENYGRSREFALAREQGAMSLGGKLSTRIAAFWDTPQFAMQSI
jgi:hypothetical protein